MACRIADVPVAANVPGRTTDRARSRDDLFQFARINAETWTLRMRSWSVDRRAAEFGRIAKFKPVA